MTVVVSQQRAAQTVQLCRYDTTVDIVCCVESSMARKLSVGRAWTFSNPPPLGLVVVVLRGVSPRAGCEPPRYNTELGGTTVVQYLHITKILSATKLLIILEYSSFHGCRFVVKGICHARGGWVGTSGSSGIFAYSQGRAAPGWRLLIPYETATAASMLVLLGTTTEEIALSYP